METDTVSELVAKKKAFVYQYLVHQASINVQPISLDKDNGYRFQVNAKIPDEYLPYIQTFPDQFQVSFSGGALTDNAWERISSEPIDFFSLKTPGGTVDVEISLDLTGTTYNQLLIQAEAVSVDIGNLFSSKSVIPLASTTEISSVDQIEYMKYVKRGAGARNGSYRKKIK